MDWRGGGKGRANGKGGQMKFRKKPVVIEAVRWLGTKESWDEIMAMGDISWMPCDTGSDSFVIRTLEGNHLASLGDYIIKGVAGEFYPCKPDIFEATYEPVGNDDSGDLANGTG